MRRYFVLTFLLFASCSPSPPQGSGSLLIIAVSNFRADNLACGLSGDVITPHIDLICNESVRFTHAYTPSVLGVPALSSIMTGLYPVESGVQNNSSVRINENLKTLPGLAQKNGLETFFVSGGVPALRKTFSSKGFAHFDDSVRVDGSFYRKATDSVKRLINLIETRSEDTPFLGVVQLVDLSFPETVLFNTEREEGATGKIEEIDAAIGLLRQEFLRLKLWDSLTVVIVGLQGNAGAEHGSLSKGLNLYDEVVRVPLIIKPSRKPRDQGPSWKVDTPVTLVDLGVSLFRLLKLKDFSESQFATLDLLPALDGKEISNEERFIFSESDLPRQRGWGPRLIAIRVGEFKYFLPPDVKLFNTYTDHLELRNLSLIDPNLTLHMRKTTEPFFNALHISEADLQIKPVLNSIAEKLRVAKIIFSKLSSLDEKLRNLVELEMRRPQDWQVVQWHVGLLAENQNWDEMRDLVSKRKVFDPSNKEELRLWQTFIHLKLKTNFEPQHNQLVNCLYLALALKRFSLTELENSLNEMSCKDQETQSWVKAYIQSKLKHTKEAASFFDAAKALTDKRVEQTEFARSFWSDGAVWDYPTSLPEGPPVITLVLALANNADFSQFIKKKQFP